MTRVEPTRVRRNRMIAIVAGAITVVAIVLAFASGYLEQKMELASAGRAADIRCALRRAPSI